MVFTFLIYLAMEMKCFSKAYYPELMHIPTIETQVEATGFPGPDKIEL